MVCCLHKKMFSKYICILNQGKFIQNVVLLNVFWGLQKINKKGTFLSDLRSSLRRALLFRNDWISENKNL